VAEEITTRKSIAELNLLKGYEINDWVQKFGTVNDEPNFETLLSSQKTEFFPDDRPISWHTIGKPVRQCDLKEARLEDGTVINANSGMIGKGGTRFYLVYRTKMFHKSELLIGPMRSLYQFRIDEEPISEGSDTVYAVRLMAGADTGCPADLLLPGTPFTYDFAPMESEQGTPHGGIRAQTPAMDRTEWTVISKAKSFTGRADRQQAFLVNVELADANGNKGVYKSWFDYESEIFRREWEREKTNAKLFARSNRNSNGTYLTVGESGHVIKEGDGLIVQMDRGYYAEYNDFNNFSLEGMVDALSDIVEEGQIPFNKRKFVVVTGLRGMTQASNWIKNQTNGWTQLEVDAAALGIINKVSNPAHDVSLGFGAQFTSFRAPNGIVLNFMVDMSLDDRNRNMEPGPDGKGVMSSYVYYILDLGNGGESNVVNCRVQDTMFEDEYAYVLGLRNPWGFKTPNNMRAHLKDESEIGVMSTMGGYIRDPYRCFIYKPAGYVLG
jgi:hypothetical protein